ncbi:MAG TPA: hypothetical protein VG122_15985 [Gemmata sp.]|jgi:hypothetical protein|nr:hypothetical protein [Gemmata sp.]
MSVTSIPISTPILVVSQIQPGRKYSYESWTKPADGKDYEEVKVGEKYDLKARKKVEK